MKRIKRDIPLRFFVRLDEKSQYEGAAVRADLTLSEWLRGAARMRAAQEESAPPSNKGKTT